MNEKIMCYKQFQLGKPLISYIVNLLLIKKKQIHC